MPIGYIILIIVAVILAILLFVYRIQVQNFVLEVIAELKKVSWTTRKELIESTWVVLVTSIIFGVFIGVIDFILSKLLGVIIR